MAGERRLARTLQPDMVRKGHFKQLATKQYPQDTQEDSSDTSGNAWPRLTRRVRDGHNYLPNTILLHVIRLSTLNERTTGEKIETLDSIFYFTIHANCWHEVSTIIHGLLNGRSANALCHQKLTRTQGIGCTLNHQIS